MRIFAAMLAGISMLSLASVAADAASLTLETTKGPVSIKLRDDLAPKHAERLTTLAKEGFYNGVPFHRVIQGFMAQTGDPTGTGGSNYPDLPAEFSDVSFQRGIVGMARSSDPNSANSQFFITTGDASFLDGQYTVIGEVTSGMENVLKLNAGSKAANGMVPNPDKVTRVTVSQ
ncbi:peptidyl-prolyl cis-trans isomerase [Agaricicola taiwanensis]|uniref:Peptidyl-prolyl cis-trans isomerase n=1 Tax=Agaricicola taiwanensis TaxID=591372 RepID=A0A8J2YIF3_9RHOB|nr:peptidylprolyl isomerase [Agaricicola taiwanensis]GGE44887.1 peptidyl-prolyl cis-trans isomerase [Agaricicola taiwanensis]